MVQVHSYTVVEGVEDSRGDAQEVVPSPEEAHSEDRVDPLASVHRQAGDILRRALVVEVLPKRDATKMYSVGQ